MPSPSWFPSVPGRGYDPQTLEGEGGRDPDAGRFVGSSTTLSTQTTGLTALLVALADSAVEHQATLMTDHPVPATLAEARARLSDRSAAYRTHQQPG